jgi:hypothetical protein
MNTLEQGWREPPPGTHIIKSGRVKQGDWFYIAQLGAWGLVPKVGWGARINPNQDPIARGKTLVQEI